MKRIIVAAVFVVAVFGAVFAFAASLTVNSKSLAAGSGAVAACNTTAGQLQHGVFGDNSGYKVSTAPVTSAVACATMAYRVTLTGAGNTSLGESTGHWLARRVPRHRLHVSERERRGNVIGVTVVISG